MHLVMVMPHTKRRAVTATLKAWIWKNDLSGKEQNSTCLCNLPEISTCKMCYLCSWITDRKVANVCSSCHMAACPEQSMKRCVCYNCRDVFLTLVVFSCFQSLYNSSGLLVCNASKMSDSYCIPFALEVRRRNWEWCHSQVDSVPVVKWEKQGKIGFALLPSKVKPFMHHQQDSTMLWFLHFKTQLQLIHGRAWSIWFFLDSHKYTTVAAQIKSFTYVYIHCCHLGLLNQGWGAALSRKSELRHRSDWKFYLGTQKFRFSLNFT